MYGVKASKSVCVTCGITLSIKALVLAEGRAEVNVFDFPLYTVSTKRRGGKTIGQIHQVKKDPFLLLLHIIYDRNLDLPCKVF